MNEEVFIGIKVALDFITEINLLAEKQRYTECGKWFEYIENKFGDRK